MKLDKHVLEMKNVGNLLMDKTFPLVSLKDSKVIDCLKQRLIIVDGYWIHVYFGCYNYGKYVLHRLELASYNCPFVPMHILCKLAKKFLGFDGLKFVEKIVLRTKIYAWTIKLVDGRIVDFDNLDWDVYHSLKFKVSKTIIN